MIKKAMKVGAFIFVAEGTYSLLHGINTIILEELCKILKNAKENMECEENEDES